MTIGEWEKEIEQLGPVSKSILAKAIRTLQEWEPFTREFKYTGIFSLEILLTRKERG